MFNILNIVKKFFGLPVSYGLKLSPPKAEDYRFGDGKADLKLGAKQEVIKASGQWTDVLPETEVQKKGVLDTMGCVSFSALNSIELLARVKYGERWNKSDRFLAKVSNTTRSGNLFYRVGDALRKHGAVDENVWPFVEPFTWLEYYKEIPEPVLLKGKDFLSKYKIAYDWVDYFKPEDAMEALRYAPLQVAVEAWNRRVVDGEEIFYFSSRPNYNHAVTLVGYVEGKYWLIFDHYDSPFVKKVAWNSQFYRYMLRYSLEKVEDGDEIMQTIKSKKKSHIYVLLPDGSKSRILSWSTYTEGLKTKMFEPYIEVEDDTLDFYPNSKSFLLAED